MRFGQPSGLCYASQVGAIWACLADLAKLRWGPGWLEPDPAPRACGAATRPARRYDLAAGLGAVSWADTTAGTSLNGSTFCCGRCRALPSRAPDLLSANRFVLCLAAQGPKTLDRDHVSAVPRL